MKIKISKAKIWDYFILAARLLLAYTFIKYGLSKLSAAGQFGVTELEMATPLKDLSLFRVSWYLFNHEPFNSFIGVFQIICGILLLFNRTTMIGAFVFLPIATTILIMDMTFMHFYMALSFTFRLSYYIILDLLILWHYKDKLKIIWHAVWDDVRPKYKFPLWAYLLLPFLHLRFLLFQ